MSALKKLVEQIKSSDPYSGLVPQDVFSEDTLVHELPAAVVDAALPLLEFSIKALEFLESLESYDDACEFCLDAEELVKEMRALGESSEEPRDVLVQTDCI